MPMATEKKTLTLLERIEQLKGVRGVNVLEERIADQVLLIVSEQASQSGRWRNRVRSVNAVIVADAGDDAEDSKSAA